MWYPRFDAFVSWPDPVVCMLSIMIIILLFLHANKEKKYITSYFGYIVVFVVP